MAAICISIFIFIICLTTMLRGAGKHAKTENEKRLFPRRLEQIVVAF